MFLEKHGGLWSVEEPVIFQQFHEELQRLGVVYERNGLFRAAIYEKLHDPQWRLPVWAELRPDALFEGRDEAIGHVQSSLCTDSRQ